MTTTAPNETPQTTTDNDQAALASLPVTQDGMRIYPGMTLYRASEEYKQNSAPVIEVCVTAIVTPVEGTRQFQSGNNCIVSVTTLRGHHKSAVRNPYNGYFGKKEYALVQRRRALKNMLDATAIDVDDE